MNDEQQEEASSGNPDMFRQLGSITRQLHDALKELGYTDKLKGTVDQLPDAQSRLSYIARLTGEAAEKVLNHVDEGKAEQAKIAERGRQLADTITRVPGLARAMPELLEWSKDIIDLSGKSDARLTDIMMAQDFHDLTGQVIGRVVQLAGTITVRPVIDHLRFGDVHAHIGKRCFRGVAPETEPALGIDKAVAASGPADRAVAPGQQQGHARQADRLHHSGTPHDTDAGS